MSHIRHLVVTLLLLALLPMAVSGQEPPPFTATIRGTVVDQRTQRPIQNATVVIVRIEEELGGRQMPIGLDISFETTLTTNKTGEFEYKARWERAGPAAYAVFAFYDNTTTPGIDYVPLRWDVEVRNGSRVQNTFSLRPGASLLLSGRVHFIDRETPTRLFSFTVLNSTGHPLNETDANGMRPVYVYGSPGERAWDVHFLELDEDLVVVPADTEVMVQVSGGPIQFGPSYRFLHRFTLGEFTLGKGRLFNLSWGSLLNVSLVEDCLGYNSALMREALDTTRSELEEVRAVGFLVAEEETSLLSAGDLLQIADNFTVQGFYDEAFSDLRQAFLTTTDVAGRLDDLMNVGSRSALTLTPFFVLVSLGLAALVTEWRTHVRIRVGGKDLDVVLNPLLAAAIYSILLSVFYVTFPGCRVVPSTTFVSEAVLSLVVGQAVVYGLPRVLAEKKTERRFIAFRSALIAAFSLACRNLRRRRLRTTLSAVSIMVMVFGFVTLTSITTGYGFLVKDLGGSPVPVDGLMVYNGSVPEGSIDDLSSSLLTWLQGQPNVTNLALKAENLPSVSTADDPLFVLNASGVEVEILGLLGIVPTAEARITRINETIVEGEYLQDNDTRGVLLCSSLDRFWKVGDQVNISRRTFTVRGFFDRDKMGRLQDLDGELIIPLYTDPEEGPVECAPDQVVIMTHNAALRYFSDTVATSRVDFQLSGAASRDDLLDFGRIITLTYGYSVISAFEGRLYQQYLGAFFSEKGLAMVPFLMLLVIMNVGVTMLGSVKDREGEIATLSSVGLNPSHVSSLFLAEAVVVGFVGGGLGYLLATSGYRMATLPFLGGLQVREKVGAVWGLLAIFLSIMASVLASAIPSTKASVIVTPSLLRKWRIEEGERPKDVGQPWTLTMPLRVMPENVESFTAFLEKNMSLLQGPLENIRNVKRKETETPEGPVKQISFDYYYGEESAIRTDNRLLTLLPPRNTAYEVRLTCTPVTGNPEEGVRRTASYVRKLIFEWRIQQK